MRHLTYLLLAFGSALFVMLPMSSAGDFKLEPGFTLIFNGKDLDGWQPKGKKEPLTGKGEAFKGRFVVEKGILLIDPAVKGDSYIETTKEFKDVTIRFDFNPGAKCNNDLFLHGIKFDIVPGNKELPKVKEGEWYEMEITAKGDTVEHKVNGEIARSSKGKAASSTFAIRAEFGAMQIKNMRVKE